ncbi:MAG: LPS export ABC transporter periplasmic protein LptC [Micropepsaceae bacterium]
MAQFIQDPSTGRLIPAGATSTTPKSRLDNWEMRSRQRADSTVGYSRFVRIMKVMLPIVALSLIVLVVVYSAGWRDEATVQFQGTEMKDLTQDRALVNPKLTGTDGRGQPFTVTARGATLAPGKAQRMTIDEVKADITMQDKSWVQVGAVQGVLDVEGKTLDLKQTINIYSDRGYECHTDSARYDFGSGLLKGETPIKCQGPLGIITAKRFEGLRDPGILKFMGGVSTNYFPAARQGDAAEAAVSNPEGVAEPVADDDPEASAPPAVPPKAQQSATPTTKAK